ncbi:EPIDERMAL PATTERNING FACTOR-like protein 6 [Striga hermonthica]|uniref:Epidermal patterning factor-like protein n=1 Tax=Striga hermonthica TaxID=68872 RepID=A0A9N7R605_STRHE|nr:EPIDERMAL PATTERNING FACTOR-like protein 6 [Striga hermonthica]
MKPLFLLYLLCFCTPAIFSLKAEGNRLDKFGQKLREKATSFRKQKPTGNEDYAAKIISKPNMKVGSKPPVCSRENRKCGPCRPVLIKVPMKVPAFSVKDYYPEIWTCVCDCV